MKNDPTVKPILRENSDGTNTGRKSESTGRVENVLAKTSLLSAVTVAPGHATDDVLNQPEIFQGYNAYFQDRPLVEAVRTFNADWADDHLQHAGALIGSEKIQQLARQANRHLPELCTHDRFGHRLDVVEFHPAYHELMQLIYGCGTHSFAWTHAQQGGHVARGVLSYLWNQGEIARRIVEMMALALQASLLIRYSGPTVADAFCATRLERDWGQAFGTMPNGLDTLAIVDRARIVGA
jgi:hypothetical protein